MNGIQYIEHPNIDKSKWDNCIQHSYNGLVYSTAMYLDHMAGDWDAIILNDYEAVLPLPWRKKWGFYYIYPPAFTQQLGLSCSNITQETLLPQFLEAIPKKFRYIEMNLNTSNHATHSPLFARKNYLLNLDREYPVLKKNYSRSAVRNLKSAAGNGITVVENASFPAILQLHRQRFNDAIGFHKNDYGRLSSLIEQFISKGECYPIGAVNGKGELIAGSIYIIYKNRLYFIINGNTPESLKVGATHLLMDHTIQKFSGQHFILDFEGSDHASFARFYEQYGAKPETYYFFTMNRLPWPVNLLKARSNNPVSGH